MAYNRRTPSPSGGPPPARESSHARAAIPQSLRDAVTAYLNANRVIMRLTEWELKASDDLPPDDAWADIEVSANLWVATIRLSNDFFKLKPREQRRVLAHELMHVHHHALDRMVAHLDGILGGEAFTLFDSQFDTESERVCEALSFIVAERLPVPNFKPRAA
jgi:hypothetical protein